MNISVSRIGEFEGKAVDEAVLIGSNGMRVHLMNWGVTLRDWVVLASEGERHIVLGFDSFAPYPEHSPYFGAVVGRVANRVGKASFVFEGKQYKIDANEGNNQLHGGSQGLSRQIWDMETDSNANAVRFTHNSPDGHMGYPGAVAFEARYTLSGSKLRLDLSARPDRPTPISMVQHHYFNLGLTDSILDHEVHLPHAVARTEADSKLQLTGAIFPVAGSAYDFLTPRKVRGPDGNSVDYDLNLVLATGRDTRDPIAIATGEDAELTMRLWSDKPGLQFYNGVWTDVTVPGHTEGKYGKYAGLCFEDQMFPDALNQPHFPDIICTADRPYRHWCEIDIGYPAPS